MSTAFLSRRDWLLNSALGLGVSIAPRAISAQPAPARTNPGFGRAKSVLMIYASGGQSQLETWDPKPEAPCEVRGEFSAINTSVPGLLFGEHLPRVAQVAHLATVIRSMTHDDVDHGSATYLTLTGHYHSRRSSNPPPTPQDMPTCGAVVKRLKPSRTIPYSAVHLNAPALVPLLPAPGQDAGCLGARFDPLRLGDVSNSRVAIDGLDPLPELDASRAADRRALLRKVEQHGPASFGDHQSQQLEAYYAEAYRLLDAPSTRDAFDLSRETDAVRDHYGRNQSGQACLLARRLVEAEVPWITVMWSPSNRGQDQSPGDTDAYGWDTHNDIFHALKNHLLPRFDQAFAALLADLDERGLLDQTLVVCQGEFGRAPLVALEPRFAGSSPGRKHWAGAYSIIMAGAGVQRGAIYGASDRHGAYVRENPVGPWDVTATMLSALGIDPASHLEDQTGRPFAASTGTAIWGLY